MSEELLAYVDDVEPAPLPRGSRVTRRGSRVGTDGPVPPGQPVRVHVEHPFLVSHDGTAYWPHSTVEVPEDVASHWILNGWVVSDGD